nr:uncharacterized protein LOC113813974 [Penaeus vannamei]
MPLRLRTVLAHQRVSGLQTALLPSAEARRAPADGDVHEGVSQRLLQDQEKKETRILCKVPAPRLRGVLHQALLLRVQDGQVPPRREVPQAVPRRNGDQRAVAGALSAGALPVPVKSMTKNSGPCYRSHTTSIQDRRPFTELNTNPKLLAFSGR